MGGVAPDNKVGMRAGSTGNHVRYVLIASTALDCLLHSYRAFRQGVSVGGDDSRSCCTLCACS
jgi:hypothetical protein